MASSWMDSWPLNKARREYFGREGDFFLQVLRELKCHVCQESGSCAELLLCLSRDWHCGRSLQIPRFPRALLPLPELSLPSPKPGRSDPCAGQLRPRSFVPEATESAGNERHVGNEPCQGYPSSSPVFSPLLLPGLPQRDIPAGTFPWEKAAPRGKGAERRMLPSCLFGGVLAMGLGTATVVFVPKNIRSGCRIPDRSGGLARKFRSGCGGKQRRRRSRAPSLGFFFF